MSKQHTLTTISKYIDREITDIRIKVYSGAPSDEIEHRLHGLNLSVIDKLGKVQNNHNRLIEALENTSKALSDTLLNTDDGFPHRIYNHAYEINKLSQQLLTELKA